MSLRFRPKALVVAGLLLVFAAGALLGAGTAHADVGTCIGAPADGYGTDGPDAVAVTTFANASAPQTVSIYAPATGSGPFPVIFFSHGLGASDTSFYDDYLRHMASRGLVVVYSPYDLRGIDASAAQVAYEQLWSGFLQAVQEYGAATHMDLTKVGFVGHSFGGGATPEMFRRGVEEQGWGSAKKFMELMAPYQPFDITPDQLAHLPADTNLLVEVFGDDQSVDQRFAIDDIWTRTPSIPDARRDYVLLSSATHGACVMTADHGVPVVAGARYGVLDDYDVWGIWRRTDALVACTFAADARACGIALGHGSAAQANMGSWLDDGTAVPPVQRMATPVPVNCAPAAPCKYRYPSGPDPGAPSAPVVPTAPSAPSIPSAPVAVAPAPVALAPVPTPAHATSRPADFGHALGVRLKLSASGRLSLSNTNPFTVAASAALHPRGHASSTALGQGSGHVAGRTSKSITLKLTRAARSALRHERTLRVEVAVRLRSPAGSVRTAHAAGTLKATK